jgi:hypothetical protein
MLVGRQLQQVVAACEMDGATENYYLPCFFLLLLVTNQLIINKKEGRKYYSITIINAGLTLSDGVRAWTHSRKYCRPLSGRFAGVAIQQTPRNCEGLPCPPLLALSVFLPVVSAEQ